VIDSSVLQLIITSTKRRLHIDNFTVKSNENLMLIDGGSTNGVARAIMSLLGKRVWEPRSLYVLQVVESEFSQCSQNQRQKYSYIIQRKEYVGLMLEIKIIILIVC